MKSRQFAAIHSSLLLSLLVTANCYASFEAHEWGTFTSLVGSNGVTQNGMYHEDEALPGFVHGFAETKSFVPITEVDPSKTPIIPRPPCHSKACFGQDVTDKNIITQKMETPVIYFYADGPQKVDVNVRFPEGVITETFPAPVESSPQKSDELVIANGKAKFSVNILQSKSGKLPYVQPGNIYGNARAVNSNLVQNGDETEKFIFYRGLGRFQPKLSIQSSKGNLQLYAPTGALPLAIFLVNVDRNGDAQMFSVDALVAGTMLTLPALKLDRLRHPAIGEGDMPYRGAEIKNVLSVALQKAGLNVDESLAMLNTWESGYLKVQGLRLLYILPRVEVDQALPLQFEPPAQKFTRVFVGRIEVLLDTEEQQILKDIFAAGLNFDVNSLGRFAEPMLRRVQEVYHDQCAKQAKAPTADSLLQELISRATKTDFATAKSSIR